MFDDIIEFIVHILFDNLFFTVGVIFTRVVTLGKYPSLRIKEKYKILFQTIGLIVSVAILVSIVSLFNDK